MTPIEVGRRVGANTAKRLRAPESGHVHLWRARLVTPPAVLDDLAASLSGDERKRAWRFPSARHRNDFIAAHGWLRLLLSRYLDIPPGELELVPGDSGKPRLAGAGPTDLRFSMAHSQGSALYGVASREIGVDLEWISDRYEWDGIARLCFSPGERAWLRTRSGDERTRIAFEIWTCKEAWVKAVGLGLVVNLVDFDVSGGDEPMWLGAALPREAEGRWTVRPLNLGHGFAAAVAVAGRGVRIGPVREIDRP